MCTLLTTMCAHWKTLNSHAEVTEGTIFLSPADKMHVIYKTLNNNIKQFGKLKYRCRVT